MDNETPTFPLEDRPLRIKDRYQIDRELGRGGMGVVYLARDLQLHNRPVVIKVLRDLLASDWHTKKFRQEIEALVRIEHPGVVGIFDAGEMPDGRLYVVMQFVEGTNLRSVLKAQKGPMSLAKISQIIDQIARALTAAHEKGVLHCDLKPENIMLQQLQPGEEIAKLIDFGIAKIRDSQISSAEPTKIAGTMEYMAPEQLAGNPSRASDIFALGVICYELVTGQKPYPSNNLVQLFDLHRNGVQQRPSELRPDLPKGADDVILKVLSFDPNNRHATARQFSEDFASSLQADTLEATRQITPLPPKKFLFSAAMTTAAFAAVALLVWWMTRSPQQTAVDSRIIAPMQTSAPQVQAPNLFLNYSILVQKYRDGKTYGDPFRLAKEINFEPDYRIQMKVRSPEAGFLYLLNEGPQQANGLPQFNLLFPTSLDANHSAEVREKQEVQIPGKGWLKFDEEQGTEKLWIIFSKNAVPEFESVKEAGNTETYGEIRDASKIKTLSDFLRDNPKAETEQDPENVQTVIKARGDTLLHLVLLEHH